MKRTRLVVALAAAVVLGCLAFALFSSREPRYQGRTVSEIITVAYEAREARLHGFSRQFHYPEDDPDWQASSYALKQIAPNAIPFLLRWVQTDDIAPAPENSVLQNLRAALSKITKEKPPHRQEMAFAGFRLLGTDAKPALPALVQITHDEDWRHRFCAVQCLEVLKPEKDVFVPVLTRLSHDSTTPVRTYAAYLLQQSTNN